MMINFDKLAFVRHFSDIKDDKHTMETCFNIGNVTFFSFICKNWSVRIYPTFKIPDNSFFTNAAKQMTKEKLIIGDLK